MVSGRGVVVGGVEQLWRVGREENFVSGKRSLVSGRSS